MAHGSTGQPILGAGVLGGRRSAFSPGDEEKHVFCRRTRPKDDIKYKFSGTFAESAAGVCFPGLGQILEYQVYTRVALLPNRSGGSRTYLRSSSPNEKARRHARIGSKLPDRKGKPKGMPAQPASLSLALVPAPPALGLLTQGPQMAR